MKKLVLCIIACCGLLSSCMFRSDEILITNRSDHEIASNGYLVKPGSYSTVSRSSRVMCPTHDTDVVIISESSEVFCDGTRIQICR